MKSSSRTRPMIRWHALLLCLLAWTGMAATPARSQTDSEAAVAVVKAFHDALSTGDSAKALSFLAPDLIVMESGGVETLAEFRSHHLPADIAFARAVSTQRGAFSATIEGDVAWVSSTGVTQGEFRGRQINNSSAELIVLSRSDGGWKIRAVHWSSRRRR